jgi:hypothetical protein
MNIKARRKLEMGARALEFSRKHPDAGPGYDASVARLENRLNRAAQLEAQQREGILLSRAANARKKELRRDLKQGLIGHLVSVAEAASAEAPELSEKFTLPTTIAFPETVSSRHRGRRRATWWRRRTRRTRRLVPR